MTLPESVDVTTLGRRRAAGAAGAGTAAPPRGVSAGRRAGPHDGDDEIHVPVAGVDARASAVSAGRSALFYRARPRHPDQGERTSPAHQLHRRRQPRLAPRHGRHQGRAGDAGRDLTSLAAADYFFRNRYRRAYFKHFTNLVPMERSGSIRKSMDTAHEVLRRGRSMVVFPEGTRSVSGDMADFLPSLGYLALRAEVGILPAHVAGSFESLPKGAAVPRARDLTVSFGPFLAHRLAGGAVQGSPAQEGWRLVSAFAQRVVENLRDGVATVLDAEATRAAWDGKALGPIAVPRAGAPPALPPVGAMTPP